MFVCLFVLSNVKSKISYWIAQTFFFIFWENVKTHPILNVVTYLLHLLEVTKQSGQLILTICQTEMLLNVHSTAKLTDKP